MEEFICSGRTNLLLLVKERLEKKYNLEIVLGEIVIDKDEQQWLTLKGGLDKHRAEVKRYIITLCSSEDACIVSYNAAQHDAILRHHDRLERETEACLVFPVQGTVNIYGSNESVTLALSLLESLKDSLPAVPATVPVAVSSSATKVGHVVGPSPTSSSSGEQRTPLVTPIKNERSLNVTAMKEAFISEMTEDELNEKLKAKCLEHDIAFEDYANQTLTLRRTLFRWLSEDMDKSNSLIEDDLDGVEADCEVVDRADSLDYTLRQADINDSKMHIILKHGYTKDEYDAVRRELGDNAEISTLLTKLMENQKKKNATAGNDKKSPSTDVIDLTEENLMVYFGEYFDEGANLSREEYMERNIKRQQLLLAEVEKRKNTSVLETTAQETPKKKTKKKKRKKKKKKQGGTSSQSASAVKSDSSSSSDDGEEEAEETKDDDYVIIDAPSQLETIDVTGNLDQTEDRTVVERTPARQDVTALYRTVDATGPDLSLPGPSGLIHSPMADNEANKKRQKRDTTLLDDTIIGRDTTFDGPLHSTPVPTVPRASRLGARFGDPEPDSEWSVARRRRASGGRPIKGASRSPRRSPVRGSPDVYELRESRVPAPLSDYEPKPIGGNLRPIVIDGSNVACAHGRNRVFSSRGIKYAVDYFKARGHPEITVFVPNWRKGGINAKIPTVDNHVLIKLEEEGILSFTPSRYLNGKKIVSYDDRFIIELAAVNEGVVVSNDNYRDLINEKPQWKHVIEHRLLMYTFAGDHFMIPDDPLGPQGPKLSQFLTKPGRNDRRPPVQPLLGDRPALYPPLDHALGHNAPVPPGAPGWTAHHGLSGAPGGPLPAGRPRPTYASTRPPPCRAPEVTDTLYKQLLEMFPQNGPVVRRILDNHMDETDVNKLTIHILDVMR